MNKYILLGFTLLFVNIFTTDAATNISGQIRSNTTWTKAGSPYTCEGMVEIAHGVTLTIDPGVTAIMDNDIRVYGWLILNTTSTDSITFKADLRGTDKSYNIFLEESALTNSTVSLYKLQYINFHSVGISLRENAMSTEVSDCRFEGHFSSIFWHYRPNASITIHDNYLSGSVHINGPWEPINSVKIYNNNFDNPWNSNTLYIRCKTDTLNIHNNIFNNGGTSITIYSMAKALITANVFMHNQVGIYGQGAHETEFHLEENIFTDNEKAILLSGNGHKNFTITHNTIYNNDYGILVSTNLLAHNISIDSNCIYQNKSGLFWNAANNINIGANWWGSTDTSVIDTCIADFKDDFHKGIVAYRPFLSSSSGCKTYTPPTDIPNLPNNTKARPVLYPNPFSHSLTITTDKSAQMKEVSLFNITGVKVTTTQGMKGNTATIDTRQLPAGMYIYKVTYADQTTTGGKVLKQ